MKSLYSWDFVKPLEASCTHFSLSSYRFWLCFIKQGCGVSLQRICFARNKRKCSNLCRKLTFANLQKAFAKNYMKCLLSAQRSHVCLPPTLMAVGLVEGQFTNNLFWELHVVSRPVQKTHAPQPPFSLG